MGVYFNELERIKGWDLGGGVGPIRGGKGPYDNVDIRPGGDVLLDLRSTDWPLEPRERIHMRRLICYLEPGEKTEHYTIAPRDYRVYRKFAKELLRIAAPGAVIEISDYWRMVAEVCHWVEVEAALANRTAKIEVTTWDAGGDIWDAGDEECPRNDLATITMDVEGTPGEHRSMIYS